MEKMMIRLLPKVDCGEDKDNVPFLNVFRSSAQYEDIHGYFFRSAKGVAVIINDNISKEKQAQAIIKIKKGIQKCMTSEMGLVDSNGTYHCGGSLCCGKKNMIASESE